MTDPTKMTMSQIAETMSETEIMWAAICNGVEDNRVDMLVDALEEQHALVMEGETNSNAVMALVGFISRRVMALHDQGEMSLEAAMVLVQIGMQRGVQAHLSFEAKKGST